ncbi:ISAs1 family transposase [Gemmata sp. SH-PL17]|uniref:ISAs1 family transposase n=1 Tax=Gemmata sp. SH-PL17 TaxID=1630693 RepID=UPI00138FC584|nr:ISAs1 family transposase [Gemmata sp. SH-PL17]
MTFSFPNRLFRAAGAGHSREPTAGPRFARTTEKGHGRVEYRALEGTAILTVHQKWPGLKPEFRVRQRGIRKGKAYEKVVHGITSLPPEKTDAKRLLGLVREHRRIENRLHYVRDVTLGEDACPVRRGSAPEVPAALRNAGVHLLAQVDAGNHARAIRRRAARFREAIDLLTSPV